MTMKGKQKKLETPPQCGARQRCRAQFKLSILTAGKYTLLWVHHAAVCASTRRVKGECVPWPKPSTCQRRPPAASARPPSRGTAPAGTGNLSATFEHRHRHGH